jgi:hypothetical protein
VSFALVSRDKSSKIADNKLWTFTNDSCTAHNNHCRITNLNKDHSSDYNLHLQRTIGNQAEVRTFKKKVHLFHVLTEDLS